MRKNKSTTSQILTRQTFSFVKGNNGLDGLPGQPGTPGPKGFPGIPGLLLNIISIATKNTNDMGFLQANPVGRETGASPGRRALLE